MFVAGWRLLFRSEWPFIISIVIVWEFVDQCVGLRSNSKIVLANLPTEISNPQSNPYHAIREMAERLCLALGKAVAIPRSSWSANTD